MILPQFLCVALRQVRTMASDAGQCCSRRLLIIIPSSAAEPVVQCGLPPKNWTRLFCGHVDSSTHWPTSPHMVCNSTFHRWASGLVWVYELSNSILLLCRAPCSLAEVVSWPTHHPGFFYLLVSGSFYLVLFFSLSTHLPFAPLSFQPR